MCAALRNARGRRSPPAPTSSLVASGVITRDDTEIEELSRRIEWAGRNGSEPDVEAIVKGMMVERGHVSVLGMR
jgi:hypothetical protein